STRDFNKHLRHNLQVAFYILIHTIRQRSERFVIPCSNKLRRICLGEILILAPQCLRHLDETYVRRPAHRSKECVSQIKPGLCTPGTTIKQPACGRFENKMQRNINGVTYVDEVPFLFSVLKTAVVRFEQLNITQSLHLMVGLMYQ